MRSFVLIFLLVAGILSPAAAPADERVAGTNVPPVIGPHPPIWRFNGPPQDPPFSRSARSQSVWDAGACWSQCQSYCAWSLTQCLYDDGTQGACAVNNDSCDLVCQKSCRSWTSGPFLPID
ncbi:MAG: hypothetical protein ACXVG9_12630 [Terriglobales bacterium]